MLVSDGCPRGVGAAPLGREGGLAGIDEFLRYKTVSIIEAQ
jgi:hypothetical protein